jgi:hypothetical protein
MICQSKRHESKVLQEVVKYLGVAKSAEQLTALKRIGLAEIHALKHGQQVEECPKDTCEGAFLGHINEIARVSEGFHEVFVDLSKCSTLARFTTKNCVKDSRTWLLARLFPLLAKDTLRSFLPKTMAYKSLKTLSTVS